MKKAKIIATLGPASDNEEIMEALSRQKAQLDKIEKKQNWLTDFGSDIAANFLTDGLIWLGSRLFKRF